LLFLKHPKKKKGQSYLFLILMPRPRIIKPSIRRLLVLLAATAPLVTLASLATSSPPPKEFFDFLPPNNGPIDDAQCTIQDLEKANDSQLHTILNELKMTNFFKSFVVDLEHKCPLRTFGDGGGSGHGEDHDSPDEKEQEEEEFECDGGTTGLDLDDDAEPLCTIDNGGADPSNPFGGGGNDAFTSSPFLESNVLHTLKNKGFQSPQQAQTFDWQQQTDMVVVDKQEPLPCEDGEAYDYLPETFWMDMCSNIKEGDGTKLVNLALNPERNTGYDGRHIWKAIYDENCIEHEEMCLEERVLYRLLSGLHTSTTLSIAKNYYPPSKRKNRVDWEANPQYFMDKFQNHPEYIRNLYFSYVVMLRGLRKASPYLYNYQKIQSGNQIEDDTTKVLLKRLLDSAILRSCSSVFSAFDESIMFQESSGNVVSLQQNFKGVFHNISSILDCVQCQQCKLHGKMAMLGYGTALKILFLPTELLSLERNEVVALINTIARLSESMVEVRELTAMYWEDQRQKVESAVPSSIVPSNAPTRVPTLELPTEITSFDLLDVTVGIVSSLGRENRISLEREAELIELALSRHPELLILAKHYQADPDRFLALAKSIGSLGAENMTEPLPDAIIVGSGLAGLTATLNILDRGGNVVVLEKEHLLGGNSNKASSGINAYTYNEDLETFRNDTVRSAGEVADLVLINTLVSKSEQAVTWLKDRVGVDLSLLAQLGGHSSKRTHRPSNGMAGAEIMYNMQKAVRSYEKTGRVKIIVDTRVTKLLTDESGRVIGVQCKTADGTQELKADNVILATGGFAADRSKGSYLEQYRPELMTMPATAGEFSTGDGITLATGLGAGIRDMDQVQIHPTGWVDPTAPNNPSKILAAELMRGVGGLLINKDGKRFCNELGTRADVTDKMLSHNFNYTQTKKWDSSAEIPTFHLVLSSSAAEDGMKHVNLYLHKGLLTRIEGVNALAKWMGAPKATVVSTLKSYQKAALKEKDEFGKMSFQGMPMDDLSKEVFYAGMVTPVLHYCMGGIKIDSEGNVLKEGGGTISGLHAAGEVTGGVHGNNRLGGNSLLECTVFGTIVGQKVTVKKAPQRSVVEARQTKKEDAPRELPNISAGELAKHNTPDDLWVAINGVIYDFTEFADEHPSGAQSIVDLAGTDGTVAFSAVHNVKMLDDFEEDKKGFLKKA
jgi:flavocytochrome c